MSVRNRIKRIVNVTLKGEPFVPTSYVSATGHQRSAKDCQVQLHPDCTRARKRRLTRQWEQALAG